MTPTALPSAALSETELAAALLSLIAPTLASEVSSLRLTVKLWVDETRPRNQGASLTAYELGAHGVPHTVIVDNAGGHLMQHGMVDLVITGTDRTTYTGDVANKIGTYLKALAALQCCSSPVPECRRRR